VWPFAGKPAWPGRLIALHQTGLPAFDESLWQSALFASATCGHNLVDNSFSDIVPATAVRRPRLGWGAVFMNRLGRTVSVSVAAAIILVWSGILPVIGLIHVLRSTGVL